MVEEKKCPFRMIGKNIQEDDQMCVLEECKVFMEKQGVCPIKVIGEASVKSTRLVIPPQEEE